MSAIAAQSFRTLAHRNQPPAQWLKSPAFCVVLQLYRKERPVFSAHAERPVSAQEISEEMTEVGVIAPNGYCTIVIPCYNEAKRLRSDTFILFLRENAGINFIFVNDGSTDRTPELLEALQTHCPARIHVHHLPGNGGKAEAVRTGLRIASDTPGTDLVGYWDADLATPLDSIPEFARIAQRFSTVEVIFGSRRRLLGHRVQRTLFRRLVSRGCALLAWLAIGLPLSDTQCGAKLMRNTPRLRKALETKFTTRWLFDVELFARIAEQSPDCAGCFFESPLWEWTEIAGSNVTTSAILKSGLQMLRLIAMRTRRNGFRALSAR